MHAATVHAADHCDGARTDAGQPRGGSVANTTTAFDGTYTGVATQNISQGDTLDVARRKRPDNLQNYSVLPPLTIHNGLAQFQLLNYTFQGYVTPQGCGGAEVPAAGSVVAAAIAAFLAASAASISL